MTPTWGQLWLRACALVGWRVRAFCRGVILWRLRRHRIFYRSKRVSGATARHRYSVQASKLGQLVEVYGKERPLFTPASDQFLVPAGMTEDSRKVDWLFNADGRRVTTLGSRSSWANRRPDNYHWRRSAMEE